MFLKYRDRDVTGLKHRDRDVTGLKHRDRDVTGLKHRDRDVTGLKHRDRDVTGLANAKVQHDVYDAQDAREERDANRGKLHPCASKSIWAWSCVICVLTSYLQLLS